MSGEPSGPPGHPALGEADGLSSDDDSSYAPMGVDVWSDEEGSLFSDDSGSDEEDEDPPPPEPPPEPPPGEDSGDEEEPPDPDSTTSIAIATWNIRNGRNSGLELALGALDKMGTVDLCFLTEVKATGGIYTRHAYGYDVVATEAMSVHRGGIALAYQASPYWQVESTQCHGPNVMSCVLVSGRMRQPLVGVYIPPTDETTIGHLEKCVGPVPRRGPHPHGTGGSQHQPPEPRRGSTGPADC